MAVGQLMHRMLSGCWLSRIPGADWALQCRLQHQPGNRAGLGAALGAVRLSPARQCRAGAGEPAELHAGQH